MMPRDALTKVFLFFIGGLLVLAGGMLLISFILNQQTASTPETPFPPEIRLDAEALTARAAIVYDPVTNRALFSKNANEPLPLASLTKLMAAQAVLLEHPSDILVTISQESLRSEGDSGVRAGEVWSLYDLLMLGLVASSNDAMAAATGSVEGGVVEAMNRATALLGLTETYFLNPTGLDLDLETSGAYGSAHDVAVLATAFMRHHSKFFEATAKETVTIRAGGRVIEATSTASPLLSTYGFIGAKTGYTDLAGGNLVAAFDIAVGHPLVVVVLGSTHEGRFKDIRTLITAVHKEIEIKNI